MDVDNVELSGKQNSLVLHMRIMLRKIHQLGNGLMNENVYLASALVVI